MSEQLSLVQVSNCTLTITAAEFEPGLAFTDWQEAGKRLCRVSACVNWWIGDWINYGQAAYGEKYTAALEVTGLDEQTLLNVAYVCRAVNLPTRVDVLSWSHHREVASLVHKQQQHWLALAVEGKWTVSQLRQAMRAAQADDKPKDTDNSMGGFSVAGWVMKGALWFKQRMNATPIEQWPKEQKDAIKEQLQPIVDVYQRL
jgi:hypothetical protein